MTDADAPLPPASSGDPGGFGPWNPGIVSQVPRQLRHLMTLFRPEHVFGDYEKARELADFSGLPELDVLALRPERLALHEVLVRVTAEYTVPDGTRIADLGINFRDIVRTLYASGVAPRIDEVVAVYDAARQRLAAAIAAELAAASAAAPPTPAPSRSWLRRLFGGGTATAAALLPPAGDERAAIAAWEARARGSADDVQRAACAALARVASALYIRHGGAWGRRELTASLALDLACNDHAAAEVGRAIDPWLRAAADAHGYRRLPAQAAPVVMNTKGPSASGKSTLRPLQKRLAGEIGVPWADFALISPDIWRKQLLDYASLGPHYKYAGACTGDEVLVVDQKLDAYMAQKARRGDVPHLLIDRFRFDSVAADSGELGGNLLTRFGHVVYLFFVVTPPAALVERAWYRGLEVGRYKAVDDTLAHSVEAYEGMAELLFTWVRRRDKHVHFEFLDNDVPRGERPRTAAFGDRDELVVLDVRRLLDVERFRRVNIDAAAPEELFRDAEALAPERSAGFLAQCVAQFARVRFADQATGRVYLALRGGAVEWADAEGLVAAAADPDMRAGLATVVPGLFDRTWPPPAEAVRIEPRGADGRTRTLGAWGDAG